MRNTDNLSKMPRLTLLFSYSSRRHCGRCLVFRSVCHSSFIIHAISRHLFHLLTFHQPRVLPPFRVALFLKDDTGFGVDRTRHRFTQFRGIHLAALNDDSKVATKKTAEMASASSAMRSNPLRMRLVYLATLSLCANPALAHEHHEENIPEGQGVSPEPLVGLSPKHYITTMTSTVPC